MTRAVVFELGLSRQGLVHVLRESVLLRHPQGRYSEYLDLSRYALSFCAVKVWAS